MVFKVMFLVLFWKSFNLGVDGNILLLLVVHLFPQQGAWELNFDGSDTGVQEGQVQAILFEIEKQCAKDILTASMKKVKPKFFYSTAYR